MREKLLSIEQMYQVKILYACKAGSRAWGLSSPQSDYDVRFIYIHPTEWYLSIDQKREVIEQPISNSLDLSGWDIRKALLLLKKSNPSLLEWIYSGIPYLEYGSFHSELALLAKNTFSANTCMWHYLNMAKRNAKDLSNQRPFRVKQLLAVLRPILICKWIELNGSFPHSNFSLLVECLIIDPYLKMQIEKIIKQKIEGQNYIELADMTLIFPFVQLELAHIEEYVQTIPAPSKTTDLTETLNQLFRTTLKDVWQT